MSRRLPRRLPQTITARLVCLASGLLLLLVVLAPCALWLGGWRNLGAAALSAFVCGLGGALAILVRVRLPRPEQAFQALAWAMAARLTPPLAGLVFLIFSAEGLDKSPAIYYLLVFYLAALALEAWLAVPPTGRRDGCEPR